MSASRELQIPSSSLSWVRLENSPAPFAFHFRPVRCPRPSSGFLIVLVAPHFISSHLISSHLGRRQTDSHLPALRQRTDAPDTKYSGSCTTTRRRSSAAPGCCSSWHGRVVTSICARARNSRLTGSAHDNPSIRAGDFFFGPTYLSSPQQAAAALRSLRKKSRRVAPTTSSNPHRIDGPPPTTVTSSHRSSNPPSRSPGPTPAQQLVLSNAELKIEPKWLAQSRSPTRPWASSPARLQLLQVSELAEIFQLDRARVGGCATPN